jgi:hypothetical protein
MAGKKPAVGFGFRAKISVREFLTGIEHKAPSPAAGSAVVKKARVLLPRCTRARGDPDMTSGREDREPATAVRKPVAVIASPVAANVSPNAAPVAAIVSPISPPFASRRADDREPLQLGAACNDPMARAHYPRYPVYEADLLSKIE